MAPALGGASGPEPAPPAFLGLEALVAGLAGQEWLYVVMASPLGAGERQQELQRAFAEESRARLKHLRPGTVLEKIHPQGRAIVTRAEARSGRLKEGLITGLWHTCCVLYLREPAAFTQAASILMSAFGGEHAQPDPLRVQFCIESAGSEKRPNPLSRPSTAPNLPASCCCLRAKARVIP
jgi:hypothetical protein